MDEHSNTILPGSRGLWQPERKYRDVISVMSEGVVILTREGIQESNASADVILELHTGGQDGCAAEDPNTELFNADGSPLARENHPCFITLATGKSYNDIVIGFRRPGKPIKWCSLNTRPIWTTPGDAPDAVVSSVRDVTEELKTKALIEQARVDAEARAHFLESEYKRLQDVLSELQVQTQERENFVSTLSHDLRTPLSIAMIGAQRILREPESSAVIHKGAERILGSIRRLDRMIRDLLDANRLKAGQGVPVQRQQASLTQVVKESCEGLKVICGERLSVQTKGEITGTFCSNGMYRVMENLINNAVKYGAVDAPITVSVDELQGSARIVVHNFGNPLSVEDRERLFEPYHRNQGNKEEANIGWGLGLSLVKGIVDAHEGKIEVSSSVEEGTRFVIELPL